jgi:hypothetical protein
MRTNPATCPTHKIALTIVFDHVGKRTGMWCPLCQPPTPPPTFNTLYGDPSR